VGHAFRSEKIRTLNYPSDRITDHRINHSVHGVEDFLKGNLLEGLTDKLKELDWMEQLEELNRKMKSKERISQ
jgi:peptide chain release factor 1